MSGERATRLRLPDFCSAPVAVVAFVVVILTAAVLALARQDEPLPLLTDFAGTALFLLWVGLGSTALLCLLQRRLNALPATLSTLLAIASILAVVTALSAAVIALGASSLGSVFGDALRFPASPWRFVITNLAIGVIVGGLALRYFHVRAEWQRNIELQARARVESLQARIRPHFLYNSMNTIAALTRTDAVMAEEAVTDLADLFRANLSEQRGSITLKEELEVARIYQRIEQLRLGERLAVRWQVNELPMRALVPSLMMQPLLENAIYHGIEPRREGGTVQVSGHVDGDIIELAVSNPLPDAGHIGHAGNGIALDNIRERLQLLYAGRASVEAGPEQGQWVVRLRFPASGAEAAGHA
jgi:two-component system, LytTR family, sensor histidine kinase AlgZ